MKHSTLHAVILITALITGLIHLVVLNLNGIHVLFALNGLGFIGLTALFFLNPGFVAERRALMHYAFIAFTGVTVLAWVFVGARDVLAYITKLDELILIAALVMHLRSPEHAA